MTDYSKTKATFWGPISAGGATGYSNHYLGMLRGLMSLGVDVTPLPDNFQALRGEEFQDIKTLIESKVPQLDYSQPAVGLAYGSGYDLSRFVGKPRIAYTTIEVDKLPDDWIGPLNQMDAVWCPSTYNKKVFEESGVTKPVAVVKEGVDIDLFNPYQKPFEALSKDPRTTDTFKFLCVGKLEQRKGYDVLMKAWAAEFKENEKVNLLLLWHNPFVQMNTGWFLYSLQLGKHRQVIELDPLPKMDLMARLYTSADAFVWATRAEGFGRPALEAMSAGRPVISPNHSGLGDFINKDTANVVEIEGYEQANDPVFGGTINQGKWAIPSMKSVREQMRYVFENQEEAKKKAARARLFVEENFTWEAAAKQFVEELKKVTG